MISLCEDYGKERLRREEDKMGGSTGTGVALRRVNRIDFENNLGEVYDLFIDSGLFFVHEKDSRTGIARKSWGEVNNPESLETLSVFYPTGLPDEKQIDRDLSRFYFKENGVTL